MPTNSVTLLDGGTGRELKRMGAPFRQPEWSALALMEAPEYVTRVHEAYVAAGAEVITTNSYAVVPFHIGEERFHAEGAALAALAGRLARAVAEHAYAGPSKRRVSVAGCLPPIAGSYRPERFDAAFAAPILKTLIAALAANVDLWLAETLSATAEADLVGPLVAGSGKPLWLSFTLADCGEGAGGTRSERCVLRSGESVALAVECALRHKAEALLFNCSQPEVMGGAVEEAVRAVAAQSAPLRIGVYANAFAPARVVSEANAALSAMRGDVTPEAYRAWARDWIGRGATIVGGCCGVGPEHIQALNSVVVRR